MTIHAVTKTETSPQGVSHTDALHVVTRVKGDPRDDDGGGRVLRVHVDSFASKALYEAGNQPYCTRRYRIVMDYDSPNDSKNLLDYLWAQLKGSAEHGGFLSSGTVDVTSITHPAA